MQAQRPDRREEPEPGWQDTDDDDEFFVDAWDDEDGAEQEDGDETTLLLAGQPTDPDMQQQQPARLLIEPLQHAPGPLQHQQQQQPADQIDTQALQQAILQQVADPQAIQWLLQTIHPGDGSGDEGDGAGGDGGASSTSGSRSDSDSSDGSMSDEEASSLDGAQGARAGGCVSGWMCVRARCGGGLLRETTSIGCSLKRMLTSRLVPALSCFWCKADLHAFMRDAQAA